MARKRSQAWKELERATAKALKGKRISRGANFAVEDVDVDVPDLPFLQIDAKYRKRHAHHTLFAEIERKYCKSPEDEPVLVTKHHHQVGAYATIRLEFLGALLDVLRALDTLPDKEIERLLKKAERRRKKILAKE